MAQPINGTMVAGIENPYADYDDNQVRREFATKYSQVHELAKGGVLRRAALHLLSQELDRRDIDAFRALDLNGVEAYTCPSCKTLGVHYASVDGVRRCESCGYEGTDDEFTP